jgi:phage-related protein (TIGR01555 family)
MASKPSAKNVARAAGQATQRHYDTLTNVMAGLGVAAKDKGASDVFTFREIQKQEIDDAYRGDWLVRKIVDIPANDMTREWRDWQAEDTQIEAIEAEEKRLGIRQKVRRALQLARLYGGAALVMGVNQGSPQEELKVENVTKGGLQFVHVLHRHQLKVSELDRDPMSPFFGEPKAYTVQPQNAGPLTIHPSRVIRFVGQPLPDDALAAEGWGDTVLAALYSALHDAGLSLQIIASLVHEAKIDVVRVPNLMANLATSEYRTRLIERFTLAAVGKSVSNTLLMDKEEEWDQKEITFSQLPELARLFLQVASGAADIPVTRLLGESPAGLNATGASDIRNYYDGLSSRQEDELRPAMERLDDAVVRSALGSRPKEIW